jgi:ribonuclease BN (tRNA processing enzyme)
MRAPAWLLLAPALALLPGCRDKVQQPFHRGPTQLVLLGTGTPNPDPDRSGPSVAVVVRGWPYLVDAGPGVVRRALAAHRRGIKALEPTRLTHAFITHLHSDHTAGLPDLILTPWVVGRRRALQLWGPPGLQRMVDRLKEAYSEDIKMRIEGLQPATPDGHTVLVKEVRPGLIYKDNRVQVRAFAVKHETWEHAYGYRFDTAERRIVISGDTVPTLSTVRACAGCDVLLHEVYSEAGLNKRPAQWQAYHRAAHTAATDLGRIARQARPGLLVLYHHLLWGYRPEELLDEVRRGGYQGRLAFGKDLDVY